MGTVQDMGTVHIGGTDTTTDITDGDTTAEGTMVAGITAAIATGTGTIEGR